ncbi:phosphohistidine phosphatase SixA [Motilimonas pumila]|uniref:Phosphohistidine phosphatase SixA n=1 Tax=Motilimonas pumila TaxID=2303987 RepID=A0A418YGA7_9GAMM|nr:phosphohistidine phosphatase SixA [Motilimonas pumila]RJG48685.1 phosphohistidine phosphatase SixA [Motilimonas pumila]
MQVYIMRHGQAEMLAKTDAQRPLTATGKHESEAMAHWLAPQLSHLEVIGHSPYLRAEQTFAAISPLLPTADKTVELQHLIPSGNVHKVTNFIYEMQQQGVKSLMLVSHLPLVGYLVAELCPSAGAPIFATSGIACVNIDDDLQGELQFLSAPHDL